MYRTLEEIAKITNAVPAIFSDLSNKYCYTNSKIPMEEEYIYIPMPTPNDNIFENIENHLKNPMCKGFFTSLKLLHNEKYLRLLHKYSPENVLIVKNPFNSGFEIALDMAQLKKPQLIILAGTDEIQDVNDKLHYNLKLEKLNYESHWQWVIDPILRCKKNQKYVILYSNFDKKTGCWLSRYAKDSIIVYGKNSIKNLNLYPNMQDYIDEIALVASNEPKMVFAREDNEFLQLPKMDGKMIFSDNLADSVLKYLGIWRIKEVPKSENTNVVIDKSESLYSIKKSIRNFIKDYKDYKKIVIFQAIASLGKFAYQTNSEILQEITQDIDSVVIIAGAVFSVELSYKNNKTIIKRVNMPSEENLTAVQNFIKWRSRDSKCAYLIISGDKNVCSII